MVFSMSVKVQLEPGRKKKEEEAAARIEGVVMNGKRDKAEAIEMCSDEDGDGEVQLEPGRKATEFGFFPTLRCFIYRHRE